MKLKSMDFIEDENGYNCLQFVVEGDDKITSIVCNEISIRAFDYEIMCTARNDEHLWEVNCFQELEGMIGEDIAKRMCRIYKDAW